MIYVAIFIPILVLLLGSIIFYFVYQEMCKNYVLLHSKAIIELNKINKKYIFLPLKYNNYKIVYDYRVNYDNVSPTDLFLCYVEKNYSIIKEDIKINNINYTTYLKYKEEVNNIKDFIRYKYKTICSLNSIQKLERELFLSRIHPPINNQYHIKVIVYLQDESVSSLKTISKIKVFYEDDIEFAKELSIKNNKGYYINKDFWDAKVRVERAKVSKKMRLSILSRDHFKCKYCGSTQNLEIDHIIPISKGGKSEYNNLQTLCHRCNVNKGTDIIDK